MYYHSAYTICVSTSVILISLINWQHVHSMVFNTKLVDCGSCYCPQEDIPVCVNEDSNKKAFKTYKSPCEWHCGALCYESQLRFMYCGECDERQLPPYGDKGNITWFDCLKFTPIEGAAETAEDGSTPEPGDSTPLPDGAKDGAKNEPTDTTPDPGEGATSGPEKAKDGEATPGPGDGGATPPPAGEAPAETTAAPE